MNDDVDLTVDEKVDLIVAQTGCDRNDAFHALSRAQGDVVGAVLALLDSETAAALEGADDSDDEDRYEDVSGNKGFLAMGDFTPHVRVSNVPQWATETDVRRALSKLGPVKAVKRSSGSQEALVEFETDAAAQVALSRANGPLPVVIEDQVLHILALGEFYTRRKEEVRFRDASFFFVALCFFCSLFCCSSITIQACALPTGACTRGRACDCRRCDASAASVCISCATGTFGANETRCSR